jgi:alpha-tubulin suppressor-like RCC1 family protein
MHAVFSPFIKNNFLTIPVLISCFIVCSIQNADAQKISGGGYHSLLICNDGTVKGWGSNANGQLAVNVNTLTYSNVPIVVNGLSGTITAVSAGGDHSLALKNDGTVWAWGYNLYGQLGNNSNTDSDVPVQVSGLTGVIAISAGTYHSMALKGDGSVWTWGSNSNGQLGDSTINNSIVPIQTYSLTGITAISAGGYHSMALKNDSTVWSWGSNYNGQLGVGTYYDSIYPCKAPSLSKIIEIDAGNSHSLAVKSNGKVMAWGYNVYGQLGDGTQNQSNVPLTAAVLSNVIKVSAGANFNLALKNDSTVWKWGEDIPSGYVILPEGDGPSIPVAQNNAAIKIPGLSGIFQIGAGSGHALAYKSNETAFGWGSNGSGQVGNGNFTNQENPVQVHCICSSMFPAVTAGADITVCPGSNNTLTGSASGGNGGPYSYEWTPAYNINCTTCANPVVNPYITTSYTVTGFDWKMCPAPDSTKITMLTAPATPSITSAPFPTVCNGNDVTLSASNTSVSFFWMPGGSTATTITVNPTTNTYYKLTTTGPNGCTTADSVQVNLLQIEFYKTDPSCFSCTGYISSSIYGGTWPYTYAWSNGGTDYYAGSLCSNNYSLTVTDNNGCSATNSIMLLDGGPLTLSSVTKTDVKCNGEASGTATVNPSGGSTPYYYSWNPGNYNTQTVTGLLPGSYTVTLTDAGSCGATQTAVVTINEPAVLTASVSGTNVSCNGGSNGQAASTVNGGNSPYSFIWSPGGQTTQTANNLTIGSYSVVITDSKGCTVSPSATGITQPAVLTVSVSSVNPSCFGLCNGSSSAAPSGGTSPYTYSWMPGGQTNATANGLCANTYSLTITDAKGCTVIQNVNITQPAVLAVSISKTNALCNNSCDGTATGSSTGGTAPFTYAWAPGGNTMASVSFLCAATYTLTSTDAKGCSAVTSASITQPTALTSTVTKTNANCNGTCTGTAGATAAGGTGLHTYLWLPSAQVTATASFLCAGTHTVLISDNNNCVISDTISVGQPLGVPVTATVTPTSCGAPSGTASASVSGPGAIPPYTYLWTTGSASSSISGLDAGIYRANVTDGNGCFGFADALITSSNGPVVSVSSITNVSCYGLSNGAIDISVSGGTSPYTFEWSNGQTTEDASGLSNGPYEVRVMDATGCLVVKSIVVTQPAMLALTHSVINSGCTSTNGSATVIANGGTAPYSYLWATGGTGAIKSGLGAGMYKVTVSDSKGCADSSFIAVQDSGGPVVFVDTVVAALCGNSGYVLLVPQDSASINSYQWNTGSTAQNLTNATPGNYGVVITDTSGCKSVLITPVNPVLPPIKPICLVTVDTLTQQNIVVWEKPVSTFIAGFNIYRETSQQGVYQKIAYSPYSSVSTYYDPIADPNVKWTRYRISMMDICGTEGPVSPDHNTIHASIQSYTAGSTTLVWDAYVGYPFSFYNIYRKDSLNGIWNLIAAVPASMTTFTDASFPLTGGLIYYHIDVDHAGGDCVASLKNPDPMATSVKSSKSNSNERTVGISTVTELTADNRIGVYPNPNSGRFSIDLKNISASEIKIFNVLGEEIMDIANTAGKNKIEVNMPGFSPGVYYVRVSSNQTVINKKVIIK